MDTTKKHPLWKHCLELMEAQGIGYGSLWPVSFFEEALQCESGTKAFELQVSEVRRALLEDGFYLSGKGVETSRNYTVIAAAQNAEVVSAYQAQAIRLIGRGLTLGINTDRSGLNESERRRLDQVTERAAMRFALLKRTAKPLPASQPNFAS